MFGQENGAPNPRAFQQRLPGAPQNFQQGAQGPVNPVMQQPTIQAGGPVYQRAPSMHPQPYAHQAPQSAMPNIGPYLQAPQPQLGHIQSAYQYPPGQPNAQHFLQFGARNGFQTPPFGPVTHPPPHTIPPPSHGLQRPLLYQSTTPRLPASSLNQSLCQVPPPTVHHKYQEFRAPLVSLSASTLHNSSQCASSAQSGPSKSCSAFTNHPPAPPLPSPPSALPNNDVTDISSATNVDASESLSVLISSDSPESAEMNARGADSVLSRPEAALVSQFSASTRGERLCSPGDSDMDMEDDNAKFNNFHHSYLMMDDITNCDEDRIAKNSLEDEIPESLIETEEIIVYDQLRGRDGSLPLSPSMTMNTSSLLLHEDVNCPTSLTISPDLPYGFKVMELSTSFDITMNPVGGTADPGVPSGNFPGQVTNRGSPMKLLQDHVSDDTSEKPSTEDTDDVSHLPSARYRYTELNKTEDPSLVRDGESHHPCAIEEASNSLQSHVTETVDESERDLKVNVENSAEKGDDFRQAKLDENKELLGEGSQPSSPVKDHMKPDERTSKNVKTHKEGSAAVHLKVDEFGRLARDVTSDSDSEGFRYSRKRARRGRSRSISPSDRRRWRSPLGRKKNRSRSRSLSPLKQRSRSPGHRRDNEFDGEIQRKDKRQTPICFNYRDGRCYRGSACRYLHHDSGRNDSSRRYKSKHHHLESAHGGNDSKFKESSKGSLKEVTACGQDEARSLGVQKQKTSKIVDSDAPGDSNVADKNEVSHGIKVMEYARQEQDSHLLVGHFETSETSGGLAAQVEEVPNACVAAEGEGAVEVPGNGKNQTSAKTYHPYDASSSRSRVQLKEVNSSAQMFSNASSEVHPASTPLNVGQQPHHMDNFSAPVLLQYQSVGTSNMLASIRPPVKSIPSSSQPCANMGYRSQPVQSENLSCQLPSGTIGMQFSQGMSGPPIPQPQRNFSMTQPANSCPLLDPRGSISSYQLPLSSPQFSAQPNPLRSNLPPPPPRPSLYPYVPSGNTSALISLAPQFQQNQQQLNISGSYSSHLHCNSSVGGHPQQSQYPPTEVHRPPMTLEEHRPNSFLIENLQSQQAEGPDIARDDHTSVQGLIPSNSHVEPNISVIGPPPTKTSALSGDNYNILSQSNYTHQKASLHNIQSSGPGISEFGGSKIPVQYNPYASTFDHPLNSQFDPSSLSQPYVRGQDVQGNVLRDPSSNSIRNAGQSVPGSGGGPYDPLYDSIEKSSNSSVKSDQEQKQYSTCDSENLLRLNASRKPLDVEETNRKKKSEAVASLTTSDNDEFGETADAEVGVVENESFNNPADIRYRDSDVEINQRSPGKKKKKSIDSRSMKLFKGAIANFVKEVLKPSWQQGNMSKEAFKTIVMKTVEKVSGAMKEHRYPKSQAKINHYIESSQQKLMKLVLGYVDKYVKV